MIGISLIWYSGEAFEPQKVKLNKIDSSMTGEVIRTEGKIDNYSYSGGNSFIDLKSGNASLLVVQFDSKNKFSEGDKVEISGQIAIYRGKLELLADEIEKLE